MERLRNEESLGCFVCAFNQPIALNPTLLASHASCFATWALCELNNCKLIYFWGLLYHAFAAITTHPSYACFCLQEWALLPDCAFTYVTYLHAPHRVCQRLHVLTLAKRTYWREPLASAWMSPLQVMTYVTEVNPSAPCEPNRSARGSNSSICLSLMVEHAYATSI